MEPGSISIVIACFSDASARRCRDAYLRETPGIPQLVMVEHDEQVERMSFDWQLGFQQAEGEFVHFTSSELEPHPGWFPAARAAIAASRIASPVIWEMDGTSSDLAADWSPTTSFHGAPITMSRRQIKTYGLPPFDSRSPVQTAVAVRTDYAFTRWEV